VRKLGLRGVVGKRIDSTYEPGERSGAWIKLRANLEQEFVIGGYIPGPAADTVSAIPVV
jgi:bifunctional non-homologous end joining protein LigD